MSRSHSSIPPLVALRAFEAVARLGSFVRAAEDLHVTTSAISHQISALEENLNTVLLNRSRGDVAYRGRTQVTPAGRKLLSAVELALDHLAWACEEIRVERVRRDRRTITVSGNAPFCALWLAPRLASFAASRDDLDIRVVAVEDEPNLAERKIDLAIRTRRVTHDSGGDSNPASQRDLLLMSEVIFPVCSPIFLKGHNITLDLPDKLGEIQLLQEENTATPEFNWDTWFEVLGVRTAPPLRIVRYSGYSLVVGAAITGGGVASGRSPLIDAEIASGRLIRLFPQYRLLGSWEFVMRTRLRAKLDPMLQQLIEFLKMEAGKPPSIREGGIVEGSDTIVSPAAI
jgi:LysR family transcriptional regulator, glycine cleavage system transcriptional activator